MTTVVIVVLVILILSLAVSYILGPRHRPTSHVHDRTLDRYHRNRDRSSEEPRAARRLE